MRRILWAVTACSVVLAAGCMPDELTDADLERIAMEKSVGGEPCPGDDPGVICCDNDQICRDQQHLFCFEPICDNGRCIKTLGLPIAPGSPCAVPGCEHDCICSPPKRGEPDSAGICIKK